MPHDSLEPGITLQLPTYQDSVIVEFRLEGTINVIAAHPAKSSTVIDGSGFWSDSFGACYVKVEFRYTLGMSLPTPCKRIPLIDPHVDTILVHGQGTVRRYPKIATWSYECSYLTCYKYAGAQNYSITPLSATINTLTTGATVVGPKTILIPNKAIVFQASSLPLKIRGITVPVSPRSWKWVPAHGGQPQSTLSCSPAKIQCTATIYERGLMLLTAVVNGVEQVDTIKVVGSEVKIVPDQPQMKFWKRWIKVKTGEVMCNKPTSQRITVSVVGTDDQLLTNQVVTLSLAAQEGTAGHVHISGKPPGTLDATSVNTGNSGVAYTTYRAPKVSGPVTIKGITSSYVRGSVDIEIGVFNLEELKPGPNYELYGARAGEHVENHYMTADHKDQLVKFAAWFASWWRPARFNDTSLPRGGFYDIKLNWDQPHATHSEGIATDFGVKYAPGDSLYPSGVIRAAGLTWQAWFGNIGWEDKTAQPHLHLGPKNACQ